MLVYLDSSLFFSINCLSFSSLATSSVSYLNSVTLELMHSPSCPQNMEGLLHSIRRNDLLFRTTAAVFE